MVTRRELLKIKFTFILSSVFKKGSQSDSDELSLQKIVLHVEFCTDFIGIWYSGSAVQIIMIKRHNLLCQNEAVEH